jgi:hypothetical protein
MPRIYTVTAIHGSRIVDGTITTSKLADLSITAPKLANDAVELFKSRFTKASLNRFFTTTAAEISPTIGEFDIGGLKYRLDVSLADSKNKPNLINPTFTAVNDGDFSTYNEISSSATRWFDALGKIDMGAVSDHLIFIKSLISVPTYPAYMQLLASPNDVAYTVLGGWSTSNATSTFYIAAAIKNMRYFKIQCGHHNGHSTATYRLYELAIFKV